MQGLVKLKLILNFQVQFYICFSYFQQLQTLFEFNKFSFILFFYDCLEYFINFLLTILLRHQSFQISLNIHQREILSKITYLTNQEHALKEINALKAILQ